MYKKVVVVGGGTAGWMSAALLKKLLGLKVDVEVVESDKVKTIGVGEATIPPIRILNNVLGINEKEFLVETKATLKLAIRFDGWGKMNDSYFHTFGESGFTSAFANFYSYLRSASDDFDSSQYWQYDANYFCCTKGLVPKDCIGSSNSETPYAYHFDSTLYGAFLRKHSEKMGVVRTEGFVKEIQVCKQSGVIEQLILENEKVVSGDLFVDCSGQRGLLIKGALGVEFDDWHEFLPCDRAIAIQTNNPSQDILPYTISSAKANGWTWRIPLQHRVGNGIVYSSAHMSSEDAITSLMSGLDANPITEPNEISFTTGIVRQPWHKNVVAVGLSCGFLEPLESTSIYLIQSALVRLIKLFPNLNNMTAVADEFNRQTIKEFELVRDFIVLHYHANQRGDSDFWKDLNSMNIPDRLSMKLELFQSSGLLFDDQLDIFREASWMQVLLGQNITPNEIHPISKMANDASFKQRLAQIQNKHQLLEQRLVSQRSALEEFLQ